MNFQYDYGLSGSSRKPLIKAISQILGQPVVYQGAHSFSYTIGDYTVDYDGILSYSGSVRPDFTAALINGLKERGFKAEAAAPLTIAMPREGFTEQSLINLQKIVGSKAALLKLALGTDSLEITADEEKVCFPWFTLHGMEGEADAYSRLVAAICAMAKRQKRVTATEKSVENARFSMRLFLIRLGFIGDEYKTARKILLKNLAGNSSWKYGRPAEKTGSQTATAPPDPVQAAPITDPGRLLASGLTTGTADTDTEPETACKEKGGAYDG